MSEPRPTRLTPEIALCAAKSVVSELIKFSLIEERDAEECAKEIAKYGRQYMDGYELAKALEDYAGWDCDLEMAQELDGFSSCVRSEIEAAEKAWAERVNPVPPLAIGARVRLPSGETGTIDEIYEYGTAKFCVALDGDPKAALPTKSRRIVNFEDVVAIADPDPWPSHGEWVGK